MDNFDFKSDEINQNFILRQYQVTLIKLAKKQNTIIYLPTGCGKTMIALHVLLSRSHEITRPFNNGGKRAFFLANTKVLVYQIASTLKIHTNFKVGCFTGEMNVDSWDTVKWQNEIKSNEVLVVTAEILRQILILKFIKPSSISLIIFDECHHANQNHPYKQIMDFLNDSDNSSKPLIMGLSSTLFKTNPKKSEVESLLQALENTYKAKIMGGKVWDDAVKFTSLTKETIISYNVVETPSLCVKYASDIYKEAVGFFNKLFIKTNAPEIPDDGKHFKSRNGASQIKRLLDNGDKFLHELGAYGGSLAALYYTIILEKQRLKSTDDVEIQALVFARTTFNKIRRLLSISMEEEESNNIIYKFSTPKVQKIIDLILQITKKNNKPTTLIFVHKRVTAIILASMMKTLRELDTDFKKVKAEFIIGSSVLSKAFYIPLKSNEEILKGFSSQELNLLFSTNVLEEGVHIPSCNFVVSFDFPLNYSSYIQSKGRARDKNSSYYVFCHKDKELNSLQLWNEIKNTVAQTIAIEHSWYEFPENSTIEEKIYILTKNGDEKKIDGITAIRCVERYCNFLKQDLFSCLTPVTWYKESNGIKTGFLQLPISCPLRQTIWGKGKANLKLAKKSVFLKTVQLLHEQKLIDDNLCFVDFEKKDVGYLFPCIEEIEEDSLYKAGTKKRKRAFFKKFANCLSGLPSSGKILNFHVIYFNPVFVEPYINQKLILYDLIKEPCTYGILSTKKFPKICEFPLFLDLGQLNCNILVNYDTCILSDNNIADIKLFHYALFEKVLHIVKNCQVFDNSNKDNSFFIVPVQLNEFQKFELNWDIICSDFCKRTSPAVVPYNPNLNQVPGENFHYSENYESAAGNQDISKSLVVSNASRINIPTMEKNKNPNFIMNEEEYLNFIICPNYRCISPPQYYCVVQCCHNLSPKSSFPREEFTNYYDYYWKKYEKKITNLDQPLLKVTHVPTCSNFNNPLSKSRKNKRIKDYTEYFVPELCDILRYPPGYWIKAQFLPAVIDRISRIFLVEELRKIIVRESGLGVVELPADSFWKPLVEEVDGSETEEGNISKFDEFLNQKLPLSELKNKTENIKYTVINLERNIFDISACDLENYMKMINSVEAEFYNFDSLEKNKEINELRELQSITAPVLNVLNLRKTLRGPELAEIVRACTAVQANDLVNYERLEILGDSFLKFASSFFLFKKYRQSEGFLSTAKSNLLSNKNLMQCALKKNLNNYINTYDFSPLSDWNPPLLSVPERLKNRIVSLKKDPSVLHRFNIPEEEQFSGFLSTQTLTKNLEIIDESETADTDVQANELINRHVISDKILADVVEAITGAYVCNSGLEGGLTILNWFDVLPKNESSFKELFEEPFHFEYLQEEGEKKTKEMLEEKLTSNLEDMLGYSFKNKAFLLEALTHPSFTSNRITLSFQRLEFLGDAVLDFLITLYIYENFVSFSPGKITDARSAIVNNITFGCLSIKYDFYKFMFSMSPELSNCIESCVKFQISRNHAIRENVLLIKGESNCTVAETVSFPKALGDVFEAIAGAIFLDSGNSLKTVWDIYYKVLKNVIDDFTQKVPKPSTRLLYEILGYKPEFTVNSFDEKLVTVEATFEYKDYEIDIQGFGKNKKDAILSACKLGLEKILKI